jgi:hypothetical protein
MIDINTSSLVFHHGKSPIWLRTAQIVLGILAVVVLASINAIPGLVLAMTLMLVSIRLLFHEIANII